LDKIQSEQAWKITHGDKKVVVAVIDTGIDVRHPALRDNLWINPGEDGVDSLGRDKRTNGIDDDGNGFVDDVHGWNFAGNSNDLTDTHGHGTHIAGIIGAKKISPRLPHGVADNVSLMAIKYYDPKIGAENNLRNSVQAILYAIRMKAQIINYSGGGTEPSAEERAAIKLAEKHGILFVAAAGNEKSDADIHKYYPAGYGLSNIITVTALDENQEILPSSNYGLKSVDLAAPGKSIDSTLPGGSYGKMTGTSQATAFVTGTAALLLSKAGASTAPRDLILALIRGGQKSVNLDGKTKYQVCLNAYRSVALAH
jgi:subtilisin family serine protease